MSDQSVKFGRYQLMRQIARGGMAQVFLAMEHGLEGVARKVVVKRILPEMTMSDDFVTMFADEARLVTKLAHPNIAPIYNFGEVDDVYYLAMEHVDGVTVSRLIRKLSPKRVPVEVTLRTVADMCAGLHYAHELKHDNGQLLGVIHRDISPQNVMLSRNGVAKLIDFGVARASTQVHVTRVQQLKGKLPYMAPELLNNEMPDRRIDIFATGVVLCEMLTGKRLYKRENEAAIVKAILYEDPVIDLPLDVPATARALIAKAIAKDRNDRFSTCSAMQDAIEDLIIQTGKPATNYHVGQFMAKWLDENPPPKGMAATTALSLTPSSFRPIPSSEDLSVDIDLPGLDEAADAVKPSRQKTVDLGPAPEKKRRPLVLWLGVGALILLVTGVAGFLVFGSGNGSGTGSGGGRDGGPVALATPDAATATPAPTDAATPGTSDAAPGAGDAALEPQPQPDAAIARAPDAATKTTDSGPTKVKRAPRRMGTLFLDTEPWSRVRVAGRSLGTTPIIGAKVPEGTHTATLVDADGNRHRRRVVIHPGKATKSFFRLSKR